MSDTDLQDGDRRRWPVSVYRRGTESGEDLSAITTPSERLAMMWQLTLDAWSFPREPVESRLPRHVARVVRRGR